MFQCTHSNRERCRVMSHGCVVCGCTGMWEMKASLAWWRVLSNSRPLEANGIWRHSWLTSRVVCSKLFRDVSIFSCCGLVVLSVLSFFHHPYPHVHVFGAKCHQNVIRISSTNGVLAGCWCPPLYLAKKIFLYMLVPWCWLGSILCHTNTHTHSHTTLPNHVPRVSQC